MHPGGAVAEAVVAQRVEDGVLEVEPEAGQPGRVLELDVEADRLAPEQEQQLVEGEHPGLGGLELGQRQRVDRVVADDDDAVGGHHQVGLDGVDAQLDREAVRRRGVLGGVPRRPSVPDDRRHPPVQAAEVDHGGERHERAVTGAWQGDGVPLPQLPGLASLPVADHTDLLAPSVAAALAEWPHTDAIAVVAIDPAIADTAAMNEAYGLPDTTGANCVVVAGKRDGEERVAACLVRADTRADVNNTVKRTLDVRKASFLALDRAVEESGMEYGGITPVGLPDGWRVLVDPRVLGIDVAVIGSGVRRSKLLVPGPLLGELPGAEVVEGLAGT